MKKLILMLLAISLLTGCIQYSTYFKFYKDGTMDMIVNITSEQWEMLNQGTDFSINEMKMEACPEIKDKFSQKELENGIQFMFKHIDPSTDNCLFLTDENSSDEMKDNPISRPPAIEKEERSDGTYYTIELPVDTDDENISEEEMAIMRSMLDFKMYFEVFGEIVETNGKIIGDNVVMFDLFEVNETIKVVFKDDAHISRNKIILIISLLILLLVIIGVSVRYLMLRKKKDTLHDPTTQTPAIQQNLVQQPGSQGQEITQQNLSNSSDSMDRRNSQNNF